MDVKDPSCRRAGILAGPLIVILALALITPGLAAEERTGAKIKVTKNDGVIIEGELLAVKGNDLIILERSTSNEVSENLLGIKKIKIGKKSASVIAGIIGAAAGAAIGFALAPRGEGDPDSSSLVVDPASAAACGGVVGIAAGLGLVADRQNISIKRTDAAYLAKIAVRLRKRARDRS